MGLCVVGDALRGPVAVKLPEHPAHPGVVGAGVQLPVGEGAGAPLPELHIALRVQGSAPAEGVHVLLPPLHRLSPLQDYGPGSGSGQGQGGEHPRRAEAHHHRGAVRLHPGQLQLRRLIGGDGGDVPVPLQVLLLPGQAHGHGADIVYVRFLSGVQGAFYELQLPYLPGGTAQDLGGSGAQGGDVLPRLQAQRTYKYHFPSLPARRPLLQAHWRL